MLNLASWRKQEGRGNKVVAIVHIIFFSQFQNTTYLQSILFFKFDIKLSYGEITPPFLKLSPFKNIPI